MSQHSHTDRHQVVPFFARYLEGQIAQDLSETLSEDAMETVQGGQVAVTEKYPSDQDEVAVTLKYPSDQEDGGGDPVTTLKYPSDQEDSRPLFRLLNFLRGLGD